MGYRNEGQCLGMLFQWKSSYWSRADEVVHLELSCLSCFQSTRNIHPYCKDKRVNFQIVSIPADFQIRMVRANERIKERMTQRVHEWYSEYIQI